MGSVGPAELIVVLVIALLVFGPKKLPEIGRGIGSAIREFKRASRDLMSYIDAPEPEPPRIHPETVPTSRPSAVDEPLPLGLQNREPSGPQPVLPPADPGATNQPAR